MTMADRIVVMSAGRIEQVGTPLDIYNRPATRFVAGFFSMPTMNFLEGVVAANSGKVFRAEGVEQRLPDAVPAGIAGRDVVLGVRSRHVRLGDGAASGTVQLMDPWATRRWCISATAPPLRSSPRWGRPRRCSREARSPSASPPSIATCSTPPAG